MKTFIIKLFGNAIVRPVEYEEQFVSRYLAIESIERRLVHYYPVYYTAAIWELNVNYDGNESRETHTLVAELKSAIKVVRVVQ